MHAATSKIENLAQGSSCQLKFVYGLYLNGFTYNINKYDINYDGLYL